MKGAHWKLTWAVSAFRFLALQSTFLFPFSLLGLLCCDTEKYKR